MDFTLQPADYMMAFDGGMRLALTNIPDRYVLFLISIWIFNIFAVLTGLVCVFKNIIYMITYFYFHIETVRLQAILIVIFWATRFSKLSTQFLMVL